MNTFNWAIDNWQYIAGALVASGIIDVVMGLIPDRYLPYIGFVRRLIKALGQKRSPGKLPIISILAMMLFISCGMNASSNGYQPEGICQGPTQYFDRNGALLTMVDPAFTTLCRIDPYPTATKITLFAVNDLALHKKAYTPEDVLAFTENVRGYLKAPGATVQSVVSLVITDIKKIPELFIAGNMLTDPRYRVDLPINDFTLYFLNKHLNEQDVIAILFN